MGGTSIDSTGAGNEGLTAQVATFVPARTPDIMFVAAGWNDCASAPKTPESSQGNYDPVNIPYANFFGNTGNMVGTQGVNFGTIDGNVAGESTSSRLSLNKTTSTGATVTPSIVTEPDGTRRQKLVLGGTAGSGTLNAQFTVNIPTADAGDASRFMAIEANVEMVGVTGINGMFLDLSGNRSPNHGTSPRPSYGGAARTEKLRIRTTYPIDVPSGTISTIFLYFQPVNDATVALAGDIFISDCSAYCR